MTLDLYQKLTKLAGQPVQRLQAESALVEVDSVVRSAIRTPYRDWLFRDEVIDGWDAAGFTSRFEYQYHFENLLVDTLHSIGYEKINKSGRYITRLRKALFKAGILPPADIWNQFIQHIQTYAFASGGLDEYIDVVLHANWDDGYFGKRGSCWWECYYQSRPTLIENGGGAIRFYNKPSYRDSFYDCDGYGRAWFAPFYPDDLQGVDGFLIFNIYGFSEKMADVKLLVETLLGESVYIENIRFNPCTDESEIPYINGGRAYAITNKPVSQMYYYQPDWVYIDEIDDYAKAFTCDNCSERMTQEESNVDEQTDEIYCNDCFARLFTECPNCGTWHRNSY